MSDQRTKLELSMPQIIGGALAAASAAVASSWLGVAGTVLGAVIVSLVASIGSAIYTHSLKRSAEAIRETIPVVPLRTLRSHAMHGHASEGTTAVLPTVSEPVQGPVEGPVDRPVAGPVEDAATATTRRVAALPTPPRPIRWGAVAASAAVMLVLAVAALTGFELVAGKSAASLAGNGHGRTTLSQLVRHDSSSTPKPTTPTTPSTPSTPSTGGAPTPGSSTTGSTPTQTGPTPTTTQPTQPTQSEPTQPTTTQPTQPTQPTQSEPTALQPTGTPAPAQPTGSAQ